MPKLAGVHAVALACPSSGDRGAVAHDDDAGLQVELFQDGASVAQHRAMQPAVPVHVDCDVAWGPFGDGGVRVSDELQQDELGY
jgi:hypothetical protein